MFDFQKSYYLENERVLLRPLVATDADYLIPFAINEPDLWRYSLVNIIGEERMMDYIQTALNAKKDATDYPFIVWDKKTNQYAGCTRLYDIQIKYNSTQLGYTWYGKSFQGTGLNKHCKYLLLDFAFNEIGFDRVEFRADANNERSIAAMKSIGCEVEGLLRQHLPRYTGGRRDTIILSILKEEWNATKREKLFAQLK